MKCFLIVRNSVQPVLIICLLLNLDQLISTLTILLNPYNTDQNNHEKRPTYEQITPDPEVWPKETKEIKYITKIHHVHGKKVKQEVASPPHTPLTPPPTEHVQAAIMRIASVFLAIRHTRNEMHSPVSQQTGQLITRTLVSTPHSDFSSTYRTFARRSHHRSRSGRRTATNVVRTLRCHWHMRIHE